MATPDYVFTATAAALKRLLPLFERTPGAISDPLLYAEYRRDVRRLLSDTRAAARSKTLAVSIADIASAYRRASGEPRLVIDGLLRIPVAARFIDPVVARSAVLAKQRANEQTLSLTFEAVALAEAAQAVAALVPRSYDEALTLRRALGTSFDITIERAADFGQPLVLRALREVQGKVIRDLIERGRPLARVVSYETGFPLPAVVLAHRLYQDAGRRDELFAENGGTDHPSFMPVSGRAFSR